MNVDTFKSSLKEDLPPPLSSLALALWYDGKGEWDVAHEVAQSDASADGSWVHAYLHRREGDHGNAGYWYKRAGKPVFTGSLQAEWEDLVSYFLAKTVQP